MPDLKLIALDSDDLNVISAHLQDAVLRIGEMAFLPRERRFALIVNRFDWEGAAASATAGARTKLERRRAGLRFERVLGAKTHGFDLKDKTAVLALLAIVYEPSVEPESAAGNVTLTFSGGAAIRLVVECVEAELTDLGAVWQARQAPHHVGDEN